MYYKSVSLAKVRFKTGIGIF